MSEQMSELFLAIDLVRIRFVLVMYRQASSSYGQTKPDSQLLLRCHAVKGVSRTDLPDLVQSQQAGQVQNLMIFIVLRSRKIYQSRDEFRKSMYAKVKCGTYNQKPRDVSRPVA